MSTLRTDNLQTLDGTVNVPVASLAGLGGLATDLADPTKGGKLVAWIRAATGAVATTVAKWLDRRTEIDAFDFLTDAQIADAQSATPTMDLTTPLNALFTHAFTKTSPKVVFGPGVFRYTSLPNLAKSNLEVVGAGIKSTTLKFIGTGVAVTVNAFANNSLSDPFVQNMSIKHLTIEGSNTTTRLVDAQGLARCRWESVNVRNAESTAGFGFHFKGVMLSNFDNLTCSTDLNAMTSTPRTGIYFDEGRRGPVGSTVSVGNSSNNTCRNFYMEGLPIGINLFRADQNLFLGGSPESCSIYGLLVGVTSRYNTFKGVGFENVASTADFADGGIYTSFENCYSSKQALLQGSGARIEGGFYESILVDAGTSHNVVRDVRVRHWNTGAAGFTNNGTSTHFSRIYDAQLGAYIYPKAPRVGITATGSPFTWVNTTGMTVSVIAISGTVTQVRVGDGSGDLWLASSAIPMTHVLRPNDRIEYSYSVAPGLSYVVHNEI